MYVLRSVYSFVLTFTIARSHQGIYHKIVKISGKKGCVEAVVSPHTASRFGAIKGSCADQECYHYKGERFIPFCCSIKGFGCEL